MPYHVFRMLSSFFLVVFVQQQNRKWNSSHLIGICCGSLFQILTLFGSEGQFVCLQKQLTMLIANSKLLCTLGKSRRSVCLLNVNYFGPFGALCQLLTSLAPTWHQVEVELILTEFLTLQLLKVDIQLSLFIQHREVQRLQNNICFVRYMHKCKLVYMWILWRVNNTFLLCALSWKFLVTMTTCTFSELSQSGMNDWVGVRIF